MSLVFGQGKDEILRIMIVCQNSLPARSVLWLRRAPLRTALLLLSAMGICDSAYAQAPLPPKVASVPCSGESTAIVDVNVVPMDAERVLPRQMILVCGDRIHYVGPADGMALPAKTRVIQARGKYLMPGLADMHTHLVREQDLLLYLARGVTTVRNMWGAPLHLRWRERIARGKLRGPTIYTAGPIVDGDAPEHDGSLIVRTEAEAERAVALHRQAGYDFIKVYGGLSLPVYQRLTEVARTAGLPVAGHVPRVVGLEGAIDAGQRSVEHLGRFDDALQADDSPVKGKRDPASRRRKLDFIDARKIPLLAQRLRERGVWVCPTRTVKDHLAPLAEVQKRLSQPEARYVPPCERALWEPAGETQPEVLAANQRALAFDDRLIRALHDAGVRLLVGTDPGNPLVLPGFSVHDELRHFVRVGLTPYQALRVATQAAAEFLSAASTFGTVAVGQRADLVLVDGNPLTDVTRAAEIRGVMARGRWFEAAELQAMLSEVASSVDEKRPPFFGQPALSDVASREFAATYRITWKGASFGSERVWFGRGSDGRKELRAQIFDPHQGQTVSLHLVLGDVGVGQQLMLESDGASGRGQVTVTRQGPRLHLHGRLISGPEVDAQAPLLESALLVGEGFLANMTLLAPRIRSLGMGQELQVSVRAASLGSAAELRQGTWRIERLADVPAGKGMSAQRRYKIHIEGSSPSILTLDAQGWPLAWEQQQFGALVEHRRIESPDSKN